MSKEIHLVKYACKNCIGENSIKSDCDKEGKLHVCDYCKSESKCLDFDFIYDKVEKQIKERYINSDELMVEGREFFENEICSTKEILEENAASEGNEWNNEILRELENTIEIKTWVKNPYEG